MKTNRTVVAACITALFMSGTAFAKDSRNYHESEWNHVSSYGKVIIAHDSVEKWGPWDDFADPAAGQFPSATLVGFTKQDPYRNNPNANTNPTPAANACSAGTWCGYAIFRNGPDAKKWHAALFDLTLTANDSKITAGHGSGKGSASWMLTSLTNTDPTFASSGSDILVKFGSWFNNDGLYHFHVVDDGTKKNHNLITGFDHYAIEAFFNIGSGKFQQAIANADDQVAVGGFDRLVTYINGKSSSINDTNGYYVTGVATSAAYLSAQRAGNVNATYRGGSFDGANQGSVTINVQFGSATWNGTWTGENKRDMSFTASGTISGANITSNNISGIGNEKGNPIYSGSVNGTIYGQQAGSIGGVSQVQKSVNNQVIQSQTAIFLVNKAAVTPR